MKYSDLVKKLQTEMNSLGSNLTVDGVPGPVTQAELEKYDFVALDLSQVPDVEKNPPVPPPPNHGLQPPWVTQLLSRMGWTEFDHDKEIAKDWKIVGLPQYTSVIGTVHAWCGLACAIALKACGLVYPKGAAGAQNWENFGEECNYVCGAFLPIRHAGGGRHITVFMYWVDEKHKIAACLGGNQSNGYRISEMNLSGNASGHDEVRTGPRWPKDYPQTGYMYAKGNTDKASSTT